MFNKGAIISGLKTWKNYTGEVVTNKVLTIKDMDKYYSKSIFIGPFLFNSSFVKVENCNRNFIRYNLEPHMFPNIKFLYLKNECDEEIFRMWDLCSKKDFVGAVHPKYKKTLENYRSKYRINKWIVCDYYGDKLIS